MSTYQRSTRICTIAELRPELREAIRAHAQRQHWKNFESDIAACCETTTDRISTGGLDAWLNSGAPTRSYLALLATPDRMIWASSADRDGAGAAQVGVASAQYKDMRLKIFTPKRKPGIAVDIYARIEGTRDKAGGRFMLDDGDEARHFAAEVKRLTDPLTEPEKPRRKLFGRS
jgi:hypothetical protein